MTIINPKRFRGSNKKSSSLLHFSNKFQESHFGSETTPKLISRDGRRASASPGAAGGWEGGGRCERRSAPRQWLAPECSGSSKVRVRATEWVPVRARCGGVHVRCPRGSWCTVGRQAEPSPRPDGPTGCVSLCLRKCLPPFQLSMY